MLETIASLTLNPTIDTSYVVESMAHTHKMRALEEHYDPGGGGINVARVLVRLGGSARCHYLSGGATGVALDGLLDCPHYTRPEEWAGRAVPAPLMSGHHAQIERWRRDQRLLITARHRPDLIDAARAAGALQPADEAVLAKSR